MIDRSRIRIRIGNREYPNFKEALRSNGILDKTTSAERTSYRKELKAGRLIVVAGIILEPVL